MGYKKTLTPGAIELEQGTLSQTKEDIRLDQIIPSEILENKDKLDKFLQAYYTFMNMDEFIYQENNVFTDVVLNGQAQFRIPDPNNENNKFFTDETGAGSSLVLTAPDGTTTNITLTDVNVAITNGNELPGTLVNSTSEIGKTFTVNGLSAHNNSSAKLTTIQKNWVGPGPSYVMNTIEQAMDIDTNSEGYLELMQKEIAATIPRGVTVDKRTLYKQIIDFYRLRGTSDSIEIFFKILFNDIAEVEFPYDKVLIPSSGAWDVNASLPKGGTYLDNKGFLSDTIVVQDSKAGWAKAFRELIAMLYSGQIPKIDVSKVRQAGARLKTFGGRASGPQPLVNLFDFTINTFRDAVGRKLECIEAHDIVCKVGEVVVVGGV